MNKSELKKNNKQQTFDPPRWLKNPHLQSVYGSIVRYKSRQPVRWEAITLEDDDFIDIAWMGDKTKPVVLLLHGLEGSVNSHYIQMSIDHLINAGYQVAVMHFRSCSYRMNVNKEKSYNAGDTEDFKAVLDTLIWRYKKPFKVVGYSLGGNVLLRYLEKYDDWRIEKAVIVSSPFNLGLSVNQLSPFYHKVFLKSLKKKVIYKVKRQGLIGIDLTYLKSIKHLRDFDNYITAKMYGFKDAESYYRASSTRSELHQIKQDTLIIHAMDDPFIPYYTVPDNKELSDSTKMVLTEYGGHVGFVEGGFPWKPKLWFFSPLLEFLTS
ncbi:alpha/beta fold hydrolase [Thiotrichales bacterium 19S3-7]|nr:alpha/beta fold hydrolase [Thiotrichales bacterium 19S3-7]MCF6802001.1 alpha/beta fold hydrolase [Thiotrichales bacterium 19S3-11]